MITYRKSSVTIAEFHFDEAAAPLAADVVRYQWRFQRVPGTYSFASQSRFLDLSLDPDTLLGQMGKNNRCEIRRAAQDPISLESFEHPTDRVAEEFFCFYDCFALSKRLAPANRARLLGMRAGGSLVLTRVNALQTGPLVWHCYLRNSAWARLIHSASIRLDDRSGADPALVGRANRYLHFRDMLFLRQLGVSIYDFGGWYAGNSNQEMMRINAFKKAFGGQVVELFTTYDGVTLKGAAAVHWQRARRWMGGAE